MARKISKETRDKYAVGPHDSFPIFDKKSAESAEKLKGHASSATKAKIDRAAAKYGVGPDAKKNKGK